MQNQVGEDLARLFHKLFMNGDLELGEVTVELLINNFLKEE